MVRGSVAVVPSRDWSLLADQLVAIEFDVMLPE